MTMQMYLDDVRREARRPALAEGIRQGVQMGREEGDRGAKRAIVLRMYHQGKTLEEIALDTGLPVQHVKELLRTEQNG